MHSLVGADSVRGDSESDEAALAVQGRRAMSSILRLYVFYWQAA